MVLNSVWEQNRLEEMSKIPSLGLSWSFHWKTVHGLKDKHVQRLLSSLTLKVWCNFTLKAYIKSMLRQHRKSSVDHHNSKVWILSVTYLYIYIYIYVFKCSLIIHQARTYLFILFKLRSMESSFIKTRLRSHKMSRQAIKDQTLYHFHIYLEGYKPSMQSY